MDARVEGKFRDHAGGRFLKEATPGGRPWEGPPGERADSTTRPQGRQEAAGPQGLQTEAGVTCGRQERGGWTTVSRVPEVRQFRPFL